MSAINNEEKVTAALAKELKNKHISGPFVSPPIQNLHCSPIGARLKPDGTARLILDLSQPINNAVNEGIDQDDFSVQYEPFDAATDIVQRLGPNCHISKVDIKSAFRLLPVKPAEWFMLGMMWLNMLFVDCHLPFGSRSSPFIFSVFSDLLAWILTSVYKITNITHYLDDYFIACKGTFTQAARDLNTVIQAFDYLGVPIATEKLVGPTTQLTYLGIEIDTQSMQIRLPNDKLTKLKQLLPLWQARKKCTKRNLLELIGVLSFATKVIRPGGRTFSPASH